jgi:hypothetical protein
VTENSINIRLWTKSKKGGYVNESHTVVTALQRKTIYKFQIHLHVTIQHHTTFRKLFPSSGELFHLNKETVSEKLCGVMTMEKDLLNISNNTYVKPLSTRGNARIT